MHILVVTPTLPVPMSGGRTRLYNLIKGLACAHELTVLSFVRSLNQEQALLPLLEDHCHALHLVPFSPPLQLSKWRNRLHGWRHIIFDRRPRYVTTFPVEAMRMALRNVLSQQTFDCVVFEQLFLVQLLDEVEAKGIPAVLVEQNVESDIARLAFQRAANPVHKLRDWLAWRKLCAFEIKWLRRFRVCVAVSEDDAQMLAEMSPSTQLHIVPNGVDSSAFAPNGTPRQLHTLLFFGTLNYGPNADGIIWFCQEILPQVLAQRPEVTLEIVGLDPPPRVQDLDALPEVHVLGLVPDIREKLWTATASIVPLHVGGGTRLKILEALAAGCPVVSTTVGAEGLALRHGEHLLIADTAETFAAAILELLECDSMQATLSQLGREQVATLYDWKQIVGGLEEACVAAVQAHHALRG